MPSPDSPCPKTNPSSLSEDLTAAPARPTHSESDLNTSPPAAEAVADDDGPVLELGRVLGGYRLEKQLGAGGMGAVFLAEDVKLQRKVALKVMKPEVAVRKTSRERFLREARAAARIEHAHIIPILTIGEEDGIPFIAMPFLKGEPLDARLKCGRLAVPEILTIGRQVAEGLAAAHALGMIHRDIKPANIWLEKSASGTFNVKILDFGLARVSGSDEHLTQSGAVMGTPAYMAPEQARALEVDHRADLFSLGVVLFEMSTGQRPFTGRDTMSILSSLAMDTPPAPITLNPDLPPILSNLIVQLLEKDRDKRIGSANDVAGVLKNLQPESTVVVVARPKSVVEANPWADIDASSTTNVITPVAEQPARASSRMTPAAPGKRASSKKGLLFGAGLLAALVLAAVIVVAVRDKGTSNPNQAKQDQGDGLKDSSGKITGPKGVKADGSPIAPAPAGNYAVLCDKGSRITIMPPISPDLSVPLTFEGYFTPTDKWSQVPITAYERFYLSCGGGPWSVYMQGTKEGYAVQGPATPNQSAHVAGIFDGKELRLFVNGRLAGTKRIDKDNPPNLQKTAIHMGHQFIGLMREVRISKVARYDKDFTPAIRFEPDQHTIALYHMDEGAGDVLTDSSGNGHHGKIVGARWVKADGPLQVSALSFDGGTVEFPNFAVDLSKPITVEAYLTPAITNKNASSISVLFRNLLWLGGGDDVWYFGVPKQQIIIKGEMGKTRHVAGVFDKNVLRLYIDGKLAGQKDITLQPALTKVKAGFVLGYGSYHGLIGEVRVSQTVRYDKDFTPAHRFEPDAHTLALYHFDEGAGDKLSDSSGNNHHGKIVGAKWVKVDGSPIASPPSAGAFALAFDGKQAYVDLPAVPYHSGSSFTLEAYVKCGDSADGMRIFNNYSGKEGLSFHVGSDRRLSAVAYILPTGNREPTRIVATGVDHPVDHEWRHIALTYDGTFMRLFLDGVAVARNPNERPGAPHATSTPLRLGGGWIEANSLITPFNGLMRDVRISKVARYDKNFTLPNQFEPDKDTIALYRMSEGAGDVLTDSSGNGHHGKIVGAKWVNGNGTPIGVPLEK